MAVNPTEALVFQQLGVAPLASAIVDAAKRIVPEDQATTVTYLDLDQTGQPVTVSGVQLLPNEPLDLATVMPEAQAKERAWKLSQNRYFQVEGSEGLQQEITKRDQARAEQDQKAAEARQELQRTAAEQQRTGQRTPPPGVAPEYQAPTEPAAPADASQLEQPIEPYRPPAPPAEEQFGPPAPEEYPAEPPAETAPEEVAAAEEEPTTTSTRKRK